jgi:AraC-like DNA-binding protein
MQKHSPFTPLHLTTDHTPIGNRNELVRDIFGREIMNIDIEVLPDTDFRADLQLRNLPDLKTITSYVHGLVTARTAAQVSDGDDNLILSLSQQGNMIINQRGRETVVESGLTHLATHTEPMSITHLNSRSIGIVVPRKAIGAMVSNLDDRIAMPLPNQKVPLQLLEGYISALNSAPNILFDPVLTHTAVTHVHDLVAFIVGAHRDGQEIIAERGLKAAQMQTVKTYIAAHLADFNLSVTSVALAHRLPLRYLQRLFEVEGTTFTSYVLTRRLEHAYRLLSSPARLGHTIGTIAAEAGFADVPHFNNMFKRRFGATPSDVRAQIKLTH